MNHIFYASKYQENPKKNDISVILNVVLTHKFWRGGFLSNKMTCFQFDLAS